MTQQTINVGAAPNDHTGDPWRDAFQKANANFDELYARQDQIGAGFTGYGSVITLPVTDGECRVTRSGQIIEIVMLTKGGPGSCVIDVRKATFDNYPPAGGDSICGGDKLTISNDIKLRKTNFEAWASGVNKGDILAFHPESISGFTNLSILVIIQ